MEGNEILTPLIDDILSREQNHLKFTGERVIINGDMKQNYNKIMKEHIARYKFACAFVKGKKVLDAACGSGYGTKILEAAGAQKVVGVDISAETISNARRAYKGEKATFLQGNVNSLPFSDNSFDVIISFETIEHITDGTIWIKEAARILKEKGLFIVSTPNRDVTNPGASINEHPYNKYHQFEYNTVEFVSELSKIFDVLALCGQIFYDREYLNEGKKILTTFEPMLIDADKYSLPLYLVAVCRKKYL